MASRWLGKRGAVRRLLLASLLLTLLVGVGLALALDHVLAGNALSGAQQRAVAAAAPPFRGLSGHELSGGIGAGRASRIRKLTHSARAAGDISGVRAWNSRGQTIYFGGALSATGGTAPSAVRQAAQGHGSTVVVDVAGSSEKLVETYVPLTAPSGGRARGVLEITAPYDNVASALSSSRHKLWLILAAGLLIWLAMALSDEPGIGGATPIQVHDHGFLLDFGST